MHAHLIEKLKSKTNKKIEVKINQNRSHYFVFKNDRKSIHLSLHEFFFKAPIDVLDAIVRYVLKKKSDDYILIKQFIFSEQNNLDFSHLLTKKSLKTAGRYFHLKECYDKINQAYFQKSLNLSITWFRPSYKTFRQITFGSYDRVLKLIRINQYLDHFKVPAEYMDFLIYHEMLHEVYPSQISDTGRYLMHTKQFKEHEKKFPNYKALKHFEKFFMKNIWRKNGRP